MKPFAIHTPQCELEELDRRLRLVRWPSASPYQNWQQGTDLSALQELVSYWRDGFSWRAQEERLNKLGQFQARVDELELHFVHERAQEPAPLALLLIHGWPSSFAEMIELVPRLTQPMIRGGERADSFDVVVPSLPGHGYSQAAQSPGMSIWRAADHLHQLMTQVLGYRRYIVAGGDWGAYAASYLGYRYPQHVQGLYLTFIPGGLAPALSAAELAYSPAEMQLLAARQRWEREEGGYEHLQSTKPQTLAYGLTDSPAGLAAWLLEKWRAWSDCDGEVTRVIPLDWLLTNICIYWFTRTLASSVRLYHETRLHPWAPPAGCRIETPTGIASFPKELSVPPPEWARRIYNVQHWTDMPRGGHFAAIEQPALVAEDLRRFARRLR